MDIENAVCTINRSAKNVSFTISKLRDFKTTGTLLLFKDSAQEDVFESVVRPFYPDPQALIDRSYLCADDDEFFWDEDDRSYISFHPKHIEPPRIDVEPIITNLKKEESCFYQLKCAVCQNTALG